MKRKYWTKNNPKPIPIDYRLDGSRRRFPPHLFDKSNGNRPIPEAMEAYYKRKYKYPTGVIPVYEETNRRKEEM